ncbi:hypothetical protein [Staphylococcus phage PMBT8]|nr:hypothetical protein [Staphylococcus phage PMBT8]
MIATLIKDHGFRWSDFDDMTDEDLHDIVNAKAEKKKKKRTVNEKAQSKPSTSMEDFLKGNGLL